MPFHKGDYYDARHVKRNHVVPLIVEALGGIGRRGARCLRFLARRAKDRKRGRDGTRYSRFHPSNYLSHHMAKIVTAAVFADAGGDDLVAFDDFADWYTDGGYKVASWLELLDLSKWVL